jgi:hypothetical protein
VSFTASGRAITDTGAVSDPPAEDTTVTWDGGTVTPRTSKLPATRSPNPRTVNVGRGTTESLEEARTVRVEVTGLNSDKVIVTMSIRSLVTDLAVPLTVTVIELGKTGGLKMRAK